MVAKTEHSREKSTEELLVVTRYLDENRQTKYDYHLSNAASDTPLEELARVSKAEHLVENGLSVRKAKRAFQTIRLEHGRVGTITKSYR